MNILETKNLSFSYIDSAKIISDVSFFVEKGDFLLLQGANGAGKSTLLRMLKKEIFYVGNKEGNIYYKGEDIENIDARLIASKIGYIMQDVNQQIVTDKVWHELAFGLENMGIPSNKIRTKVAELATYFGIDRWFYKGVDELSGGQKQLLNLASIMLMEPDILLLDEPTSMLDPIASEQLLNIVSKLNKDFSTTILIIEHKLDLIIGNVNKILCMEKGSIKYFGDRDDVIELEKNDERIFISMPEVTRVFQNEKIFTPLTVEEGRKILEKKYDFQNNKDSLTSNSNNNVIEELEKKNVNDKKDSIKNDIILKLDDIYFRYNKNSNDVIKGLSLDIERRSITSLLGANGSGKTTLISLICGIYKPYAGRIIYGNSKVANGEKNKINIALLPQDVKLMFYKNTVEEELEGCEELFKKMPYDILKLLKIHPYDLSGGEMQQVALAKILSLRPDILLLDEVSKGLDSYSKKELIKILKKLKDDGLTIIIVSHDIEFSFEVSDKCALLFNGEITAENNSKEFFRNNAFYTTKTHQLFKNINSNIVGVEEAKEFLNKR